MKNKILCLLLLMSLGLTACNVGELGAGKTEYKDTKSSYLTCHDFKFWTKILTIEEKEITSGNIEDLIILAEQGCDFKVTTTGNKPSNDTKSYNCQGLDIGYNEEGDAYFACFLPEVMNFVQALKFTLSNDQIDIDEERAYHIFVKG